MSSFPLIPPRFAPPLEPEFRPAVLANRAFREAVNSSGRADPLVIGLERSDGARSRYETVAFPADHPQADANLFYAERLVKFLLWARGGWRVTVGGPAGIAGHLSRVYATDGLRAFDYRFMGQQVYEHAFEVVGCRAEDVPPAAEVSQSLGGHFEGRAYRVRPGGVRPEGFGRA